MGVDPQKKVEGTPPFPPFPRRLEVGPLNPARGKVPQQGLGQSPSRIELGAF